MTVALNPRNVLVAALLAILALVPVYCAFTGNYFLMSLFTRIVILAMAAVSLNLIMGFGGMVSFGHAAANFDRDVKNATTTSSGASNDFCHTASP